MHKVNDVSVEDSALMKKGYNAKDLLGETFTVNSVKTTEGDTGTFIVCEIEGANIEEGRDFVTGAQNIMARLLAASEQGKLPIEVTVVKLGGNALDIQ